MESTRQKQECITRRYHFALWHIPESPAYWLAEMSLLAEADGITDNLWGKELQRRLRELYTADREEELADDGKFACAKRFSGEGQAG